MGMENNVYGELLLGLQLENQKILLTSLQEDGTLEKHIYEPGREEEAVEALAQQAAFEKKVCILGFEQEQKRAQGSEPYRTKETGRMTDQIVRKTPVMVAERMMRKTPDRMGKSGSRSRFAGKTVC